jgi:hypothetical protein
MDLLPTEVSCPSFQEHLNVSKDTRMYGQKPFLRYCKHNLQVERSILTNMFCKRTHGPTGTQNEENLILENVLKAVQQLYTRNHYIHIHNSSVAIGSPLWSSGQSSWLQNGDVL